MSKHIPQIEGLPDRYFLLIGAALLGIMAGAQLGSALQESPTNDEPVHLTAGYVYLTTGEYSMDLAHPPLGRVLAALPLLGLPLKHIDADRAWPEFKEMVWGNPIPAETIILRARLVTMGLTMLFGVWFARWTRRRFGATVALVALTFFAFDPTLIAHGHYVTTDLIASFSIFLACTLWYDFLEMPNGKRLVVASLGLGFALVSKLSAPFLLLVLPLLYAAAWWRKRGTPYFTWRGAIGTLLVMMAGASLVVFLVYAPDILLHRELSYFRGLRELYEPGSGDGHAAYLLGHFRRNGWWEYFPVAFLVKTPTGVLVACGIALASVWYSRRRAFPKLLCLSLVLPPAVYFALAMQASMNLGVRHILPIYAFLYVLLAFVLVDYGPFLLRGAWRGTMVALMVLVVSESVSIYPHYLAFFNWASGGPSNGSRYLLDSNIDWGQDLKNVAIYVEDNRLSPLCTALFVAAPAQYYGITARDLNQTGMPEGIENLNCVVAVSVNLLQGLYNAPQKYAPLRKHPLVGRIGYSVYLYDLRH